MIRQEIEIGYDPQKIIDFLKGLQKDFFTYRDPQGIFCGNGSIALWVLHDLTLLGVLKLAREWVYDEKHILLATYCFSSNPGGSADSDLPRTRSAIFIRWHN